MADLLRFVCLQLAPDYPGAKFRILSRDNDYQDLMNWPLRLDGRGWPQHTCFSNQQDGRVLLLVRVGLVRNQEGADGNGGPAPIENLVADDAGVVTLVVTLLLEYSAVGGFTETAKLLYTHPEFLGQFAQTTQLGSGRFLATEVNNRRRPVGGTPQYAVRRRLAGDGDSMQVVTFRGELTGATVRLWFSHSYTGQFCAFPSEWHGPECFKWTSLLIVDVWNSRIVAALTIDGQCFLPNKPLDQWSIANEVIDPEVVCRYEHANTVAFSPDGCLVAVWQQVRGAGKLIILDCVECSELPVSRGLPQPSPATAVRAFACAGSAAFDPSSLLSNGRTGRLAYTSKCGSGESMHTRFGDDHCLSVCDLSNGELLWFYHNGFAIDHICYDRYGEVLAATVMTQLNAAVDCWDVVLFHPVCGDVMQRVSTPPGLHRLYVSPQATGVLLSNFLAASRSRDSRPVYVPLGSTVPTLRQLARAAIQRVVRTQAVALELPLPAQMQTYIRISLPVVDE